MTEEDDKVSRLPVRFKSPTPPDRTLLFPFEVGPSPVCIHRKFLVDHEKAEVECADCKERLNPMWVLHSLTIRDAQFHQAHDRYNEEMKRLDERLRTKCDHCGRMTSIRRRR